MSDTCNVMIGRRVNCCARILYTSVRLWPSVLKCIGCEGVPKSDDKSTTKPKIFLVSKIFVSASFCLHHLLIIESNCLLRNPANK